MSGAVWAQGTTVPGEKQTEAVAEQSETAATKEARALLTKYLTLVKAKKWAEAKKLTHPKTITVIADRKKRLGKEEHPMAPWFYEKTDSYLKEFKLTSAREASLGTVVIETSEDSYRIEEKGVAEGEVAAYLLGVQGGKRYVVDKKRNETFNRDGIKLGYKGYFDKVPAAE